MKDKAKLKRELALIEVYLLCLLKHSCDMDISFVSCCTSTIFVYCLATSVRKKLNTGVNPFTKNQLLIAVR